jgi:alanine racemase
LANSAGVDRVGPLETAVRVGLWLYGVDPRPELPAGGLPAPRPVVEWLAPVAEVRRLPAGHGVNYGHAYMTTDAETLGMLGVGYADGLLADHGGRMQVWWRGSRRPVRGRVTMDLTAVSLAGADDTSRGEPVWLLGPHGAAEGLSVADLAAATGRIPWEVLTAVGRRVPRVYLGAAAREGGAVMP